MPSSTGLCRGGPRNCISFLLWRRERNRARARVAGSHWLNPINHLVGNLSASQRHWCRDCQGQGTASASWPTSLAGAVSASFQVVKELVKRGQFRPRGPCRFQPDAVPVDPCRQRPTHGGTFANTPAHPEPALVEVAVNAPQRCSSPATCSPCILSPARPPDGYPPNEDTGHRTAVR